MTSKNFPKVAIGVLAVGSTTMALARLLRRSVFDFQWYVCNKAYDKFMKCTGWTWKMCECVSDSGGIPIFTYDSQIYNLEEWKIPSGYVLLKIINCFGKTTYAFARGASKHTLFPHHTVLCYFVDEEEWSNHE